MDKKNECQICGKPLNLEEFDETREIPQLMARKQICFQCAFWSNRLDYDKELEKELLADEPLKDQIMAMRKMSGTVQSIMNLYSRKHVLEGARIDVKMAELKKELEAAKKLPAVTGYDEEQKNYYSFLSSVESFMKDMQKARDKGAYSDADYNAMSEAYEYGLSVI